MLKARLLWALPNFLPTVSVGSHRDSIDDEMF